MSTDILHERFAGLLPARTAVPVRPAPRQRPGAVPMPNPLVLKTLLNEAGTRVEHLIEALQRFPGKPYVNEFGQLALALSRGEVDDALRLRDRIPWVTEGDLGSGGLAHYEARDTRVRSGADALTRALARLKLYARYGLLPKD